ncbi:MULTISPECIES: hypothetical protein [unclassified Sphingomonas]|uniref:hypothetical protein n=1 Tax=unclassified Sphingomonas TaxID=196159 RepID=UPI0021512187|nr:MULTISPECIES: hypothetical protein [unclassified Sphingomonas]MCR5870704.1 hypothetical protein [Sphingomonas sp. J344]UUY00960.1 hypothetical protein LRS08_07865 [Sphingomonas sp. J315]
MRSVAILRLLKAIFAGSLAGGFSLAMLAGPLMAFEMDSPAPLKIGAIGMVLLCLGFTVMVVRSAWRGEI